MIKAKLFDKMAFENSIKNIPDTYQRCFFFNIVERMDSTLENIPKSKNNFEFFFLNMKILMCFSS
jgi:hypothetical protein